MCFLKEIRNIEPKFVGIQVQNWFFLNELPTIHAVRNLRKQISKNQNCFLNPNSILEWNATKELVIFINVFDGFVHSDWKNKELLFWFRKNYEWTYILWMLPSYPWSEGKCPYPNIGKRHFQATVEFLLGLNFHSKGPS